MKFTFDRNSMINEISIAQEIISTKSALSILSNVLFIARDNTLTIKATDIKVNFETKIPVNIEEEGSTTVFCDKFLGILSGLDEGEIVFEIQQKDNQIIALIRHSTKKIKFQLKCTSQDKFPEFPVAQEVPFFEIPSKDIKKMISQTSFAVSSDETRYFMNGVYFEKKNNKLVLVATDGRRLAYVSKEFDSGIPDFPSAIVHPKVLNIVAKHLSDEGSISIAIVDKMIFFRFQNYELSSTLIEGQFPNYMRVIPETQLYNFKVQKNELVESLKRTSIMVDKKAGRIFFNICPGVLKLTSQESDSGDAEVEIPCEYAGDEVTIAMNYRYIEEPLRFMNVERIKFEFSGEMKAVTMLSEPAEDYFHIIMPMQMA
ncbi:DNA polymerase III subunit beta [Treponema pectinovorum]|uniref:DNA polymerase III subunit beta n=1 Tax=Treponema pectinovorum TaxID=164 RepID=UPI0011CB722D|nr:DNA polymerase III subunit beta [Treponema pectinovorum]